MGFFSIHAGFSRFPLTLGLRALRSKPLILQRVDELQVNYTYQRLLSRPT